MEQLLQIKLFSGTQLGATLSLEQDQLITIGGNYDCDVFLDLPEGVSLSASFMVSGGNLRFNSIDDGSIEFKDSVAVDLDTEYPLPCFLQCDGIKFAIGLDSDILAWPFDVLDDVSSDDDSDVLDQDLAIENGDDDLMDHIESNIEEQQKKSAAIGAKAKILFTKLLNKLDPLLDPCLGFIKNLHNKYKVWFYSAIVVMMVVLVGGVLSIPHLKQNQQIALKTESINVAGGAIKKIFMELPSKYANLTYTSTTKGYQISGLIATADEARDVQHNFALYSKFIEFRLMTASQAQQQIKTILTNYNFGQLSVAFDSSSRSISLLGITDGNLSQLNDMEIEINNKLPGIGAVDVGQVYDLTQLKQDVTSAIGDASSALQLKYDIPKGELTISGFLTHELSDVLKQSIAKVQQKYQAVLQIKLEIKDALLALPFKIYSAYTGDPAYITTQDGRHIYQGGEVDGFKLVVINSSRLVFTGKYTIEIPLTQVGSTGIDNSRNSVVTNDAQVVVGSTQGNSATESRNQVLKSELDTLRESLTKEQDQLTGLVERKNETKDVELANFLQEQIVNLQDDIKVKQHEVSTYAQTSSSGTNS